MSDPVEWQSVLELGKVTPVDGYLEGVRLAEDEYGEVLAGFYWHGAAVLLVAPAEVFNVVASDELLGESGRHVNGNVVSWIQLWAQLIVDGETNCVSGYLAVDLQHFASEETTVHRSDVRNVLKTQIFGLESFLFGFGHNIIVWACVCGIIILYYSHCQGPNIA